SLVRPLARQLSAPGKIKLLGRVTLTYGIGQILGPLAASLSGNGASALINATLCGAAALCFAALISAAQQIKQNRGVIRE
ncbi:YbfB/YjiJ family MFS transporter, partial [Salmonella enterica]|uniref:YbfB/YjiJ family MFS transporter n=1 Tax=Salmonella enterica TaxID=28901 RepID=UPI001F1D904C